jgi:hypothetical protein
MVMDSKAQVKYLIKNAIVIGPTFGWLRHPSIFSLGLMSFVWRVSRNYGLGSKTLPPLGQSHHQLRGKYD